MKTKKQTIVRRIQLPLTGSLREILAVDIAVSTDEVHNYEHGRTISINDLPDCEHKARLSGIVTDAKSAKIVVIALQSAHDNFWRAWAGYPDVRELKPTIRMTTDNIEWLCENVRTRQEVIMMGDKLLPEVTARLFADTGIDAAACK